jgi:hypothetical protein
MARAKAKMKETIAKLTRERDRLLEESKALNNKIAGVELSISVLLREDEQQSVSDTSQRGAAKTVLLDLLREVGGTGLNAATAVELAARRGVKLDRGTAASNLSRMKKDEVVVHDGDRYRLPEFTRQPALSIVSVKGS